MPEIGGKPPAPAKAGRPAANEGGKTFNFMATLNCVMQASPDLRPIVQEGVASLKTKLGRADDTVKDYLRGKSPYPAELPDLLLEVTRLGSEGMTVDDLFGPDDFVQTLASSGSGQGSSDAATKLLRRWRRRSSVPGLGLMPREPATLLRTCDPTSVLQLDPGSHWLTLDAGVAERPFYLLLLEHDEKLQEWLCMNRHVVSQLSVSELQDRLDRVPIHISTSSGRCTIYAIFSNGPFGHGVTNLVDGLASNDAVMKPRQLALLLRELRAIVKPGRARQLTVDSIAYEVPAR